MAAELPDSWIRALVREHLHPKRDLLHLFRASRGLAAAVLQHAAKVWLVLSTHHEQGILNEQLQGRATALGSLLAAACDRPLHVALQHGISLMWSIVSKAHITHLSFADITFTTQGMQDQLKLHECCQLKTLTPGSAIEFADDTAQLMQQHVLAVPPALTCLCIAEGCSDACTLAFQHLLGQQLTHITLWQRHNFHASSLSSVTHFTWASRFGLSYRVLDSLAALSSLTHVQASHLRLLHKHHDARFHWQELELNGAVLDYLLQVPVRQIEKLVIFNGIYSPSPEDARAAAVHLAACPCLQLVPSEAYSGIQQACFRISGKYTAELVALCGRSLQGPGGLNLCDFPLSAKAVLPGICQLPKSVTTLHLEHEFDSHMDPSEADVQLARLQLDQAEQQLWEEFVAALPTHITDVVLAYPDQTCSLHAAALLAALTASTKHVQVKVTVVTRWLEGVPTALQQLVASHPGRCELINIATHPASWTGL